MDDARCDCLVVSGRGKDVLMSVQPRSWPEVPEQTAAVARAAFPKGTLAMRVRDELPGLFADEQFASAFGVRGKPGISPGQLALVTVLQFAENLTDRQAADAVRGRIDWKYALSLELTDPGFDHTVLTGFRQRLIDPRAGGEGPGPAASLWGSKTQCSVLTCVSPVVPGHE
jgi:transposase